MKLASGTVLTLTSLRQEVALAWVAEERISPNSGLARRLGEERHGVVYGIRTIVYPRKKWICCDECTVLFAAQSMIERMENYLVKTSVGT